MQDRKEWQTPEIPPVPVSVTGIRRPAGLIRVEDTGKESRFRPEGAF